MMNGEFKNLTPSDRKAFRHLYTKYDKGHWLNDKYTWKWNIHLMIYQLRQENNFINKKTDIY